MYRVELSVRTHRVRIVREDSDYIIRGQWTDDRSWLRNCIEANPDLPDFQEACREALTILGAYDSRGVRTRVSNRGIRGMGARVVDLHLLLDDDSGDYFVSCLG